MLEKNVVEALKKIVGEKYVLTETGDLLTYSYDGTPDQPQVMPEVVVLPETTMIGALSRYISDGSVSDFQPMGANFGVLPPIEPKIRDKKERYAALSKRSLASLAEVITELKLP